MSRSRRIPYIKDKPRNHKRTSLYWRRIRRVSKNLINAKVLDETLVIPNPKSIVNDYDYCDYKYLSSDRKYSNK